MKNYSGQTLQGRYKILEQIGKGGLSAVYRAYDGVFERTVLTKFIDKKAGDRSAIHRFKQELDHLSELHHPNIVTIYDYGEENEILYLVMADSGAETLERRLGSPIPWTDAINILLPIIDALDYAHQRNILHTDLSPSTILLPKTGQPRLILFEHGKILELHGESLQAGTTSMNPAYMAPEIIRGDAPDRGSDIFSLGVILYEMVTGRKPYEANTPMGYALKQINDPLPPPRVFIGNLPQSVEQAILMALAKDSNHRFQSMREFGDALKNASADPPTLEKINVKSSGPEATNVGSSDPSASNDSFFRRILRRLAGDSTIDAPPPGGKKKK